MYTCVASVTMISIAMTLSCGNGVDDDERCAKCEGVQTLLEKETVPWDADEEDKTLDEEANGGIEGGEIFCIKFLCIR